MAMADNELVSFFLVDEDSLEEDEAEPMRPHNNNSSNNNNNSNNNNRNNNNSNNNNNNSNNNNNNSNNNNNNNNSNNNNRNNNNHNNKEPLLNAIPEEDGYDGDAKQEAATAPLLRRKASEGRLGNAHKVSMARKHSQPFDLGRSKSYSVMTQLRRLSYFHKNESDDAAMRHAATDARSLQLDLDRLFQLIQDGDVNEFTTYLQEQPSIKQYTNHNGETPLIAASRLGRTSIVSALLENGDEVNAMDVEWWSPLLNACQQGHTEIVELLIKNAAEIEQPDGLSWTPLFWAVYKNRLPIVKLLLAQGANANVSDEEDSLTPLMSACARGHVDVVRTLLADGNVDVNTADRFGNTSLIWAARNGNTQIAHMLLEAGADVDVVGMYSSTPLILSAKGNNPEIVDMLLAKAANVNSVDKDGSTALFVAAKGGHAKIVSSLLESGSYVNIKNHDGDPLLCEAVKGGNVQAVKALLLKHADVNATDMEGRNALQVAVSKSYNEIALVLLDFHPSIDHRDNQGCTALMHAVLTRNNLLADLLMHSAAKVSMVDKNGDNPLHVALRQRSRRLTQILLARPNDARLLYRPNKAGETPYSIDQSFHEPILPSIFGPVESQTQTDTMLGYDVYSNVLADIFCEPNITLPLSVGLYAKWGSGKSFLLQKIKESLTAFSRTWLDCADIYISAAAAVAMALLLLTVPMLLWLPLVATGLVSPITPLVLNPILVLVALAAYALVYYGARIRTQPSFVPIALWMGHAMYKCTLLFSILFYRPPSFADKDLVSCPVSFLFGDYHRLSSIGGEQALAKIVLTLYEAAEKQYGWLAIRLYQAFKPPYAHGNVSRLRQVCGVPILLLALLLIGLFLIGLYLLLFGLHNLLRWPADPLPTDQTQLQLTDGFTHPPPTVEVVTVGDADTLATALALIAFAVLVSAVPVLWALYNIVLSPVERRIKRAVAHLNELKFEGFMQQLQNETAALCDVLSCMNAFTSSRTRLVVVVDGLDNCEHERMVQALDAIELLFCARQDRPFIVLFAVDPHIIVTAIKMNLHHSLQGTELGGHDYLKNIINMPFYLHSGGFRQLQNNLREHHDTIEKWKRRYARQDTFHASNLSLSSDMDARRQRFNLLQRQATVIHKERSQSAASVSMLGMAPSYGSGPIGASSISQTIVTDDYFSNINPRSMKRIINTLNLTGRLMRAFEMEFSWYQLAQWTSMIEQWPYRMSCIIEAAEDNPLVPDDMPLFTVYEKIVYRLPKKGDHEEPLLELDRNPHNFELHLFNDASLAQGNQRREVLTVGLMRTFSPITSNLDPFIKKVVRERRVDRNEPQVPGINTTPKYLTGTQQPELMVDDIADTAIMLFKEPAILLTLQQPLYRWSLTEVLAAFNQLALSQDARERYVHTIKQHNLNGFALSNCDFDELKLHMQMCLGDWVLFSSMLQFVREGQHIGLSRERLHLTALAEMQTNANNAAAAAAASSTPSVDTKKLHVSTHSHSSRNAELSPRSDEAHQGPSTSSNASSRAASVRRRKASTTGKEHKSLSISSVRKNSIHTPNEVDTHQKWLFDNFARMDSIGLCGEDQMLQLQTQKSVLSIILPSLMDVDGKAARASRTASTSMRSSRASSINLDNDVINEESASPASPIRMYANGPMDKLHTQQHVELDTIPSTAEFHLETESECGSPVLVETPPEDEVQQNTIHKQPATVAAVHNSKGSGQQRAALFTVFQDGSSSLSVNNQPTDRQST